MSVVKRNPMTSSSSENFYASLPAYRRFADSLSIDNYRPAPTDWYAVISDIRGSTKAVAAGKYKEVNTVGASTITALLNASGGVDIPFVFGGDGASMLIPPRLKNAASAALLGAKRLARDIFGFDLRVGMVPIAEVNEGGYEVLVAKFMPSRRYTQAMFAGNGLSYAEKLIKDPETNARYELSLETAETKADLSGLSCRWQDIKSIHGETISLLVRTLSKDAKENQSLYQEIFTRIEEIYGDQSAHHPVAFESLHIAMESADVAQGEARLQRSGKGRLAETLYRLRVRFSVALLSILMRTNIRVGDANLELYKRIIIETADYKKFDDTLRAILAGTLEMRGELTAYLDALSQTGKIAYGVHVSDRALMTCLVFERYGKQVHFIDGADGGYTAAAVPLKERLKKLHA